MAQALRKKKKRKTLVKAQLRAVKAPKPKRRSNIVWAVDILAEDVGFQRHSLKLLSALASKMGARVSPVYVISAPNPFMNAAALKVFHQHAQAAVTKAWANIATENNEFLDAPKLLVHKDFSTKLAVNKLLEYSKKQRTQLIVVSTHARKGLVRSMLGSFAETLLLHTKIPTLVINPHCEIPTRVERILLATDLNKSSDKVLDQVASLAAILGATLVLFHKVEFISGYSVPIIYQMPMYEEFEQKDMVQRKKLMDKLAIRAKRLGAQVEVVLDESSGYSGESIVKAAETHRADLVAMASQSGALRAALLGSVTREVVRTSEHPVWVVHP